VVAQLGEVDVLVNNAGAIAVGPLETMTLEDYARAMAVHFWGPLYTITEVLPAMRRRRSGRIVNISSIGGKIGVPHLVPYSASKFALAGLSDGLRAELLRHGVRVTTVYPGLMRTGSTARATFKGRHRAEHAWFSISASLPYVSMDAEEAACQILEACRRGDAELVLTGPARAAATVHACMPTLSAGLRALVNRLLPRPGGLQAHGLPGTASRSLLSPSVLTIPGDTAARRYNELA
jgi:NAD(P)-dependent dehydrogenase (short-subunit alcohol dehydrogenase family)